MFSFQRIVNKGELTMVRFSDDESNNWKKIFNDNDEYYKEWFNFLRNYLHLEVSAEDGTIRSRRDDLSKIEHFDVADLINKISRLRHSEENIELTTEELVEAVIENMYKRTNKDLKGILYRDSLTLNSDGTVRNNINIYGNSSNSLVGSIEIRNENRTEEFYVMWRNEISAKVYVDYKKQKVEIRQYTDDFLARPFLKPDNQVTIDDVIKFIESRVFPEERVNCKQLLKDWGMKYYNPLRIVKKTHGLMMDDFIWIKFRGEDIKYENIKIRRD